MGHRACYAVREGGRVQLFYSHWGALSVPEDVFWGPEHCEAFIRSNEPADEWLDDVWGEGGIGLNKETRMMTYFGGEVLGYGRTGEVFDQLIMSWWAAHGWTASRVEGMPDVAESVGEPRAVAEAEPVEPWGIEPETLGDRWNDESTSSGYFGLVSVRGDDSWEHRVLDVSVLPFLVAGETTLEYVSQLPEPQEVLEFHEARPLDEWEAEAGRRAPITNQIASAAAIDPEKRTVDYFGAWLSERDLAYLDDVVWPNWTVRYHQDGFAGHFDRIGEAPIPELLEPAWWGAEEEGDDVDDRSEDEVLAEVAEKLLGERTDPTAFMQRMLEDTEQAGSDAVWVNPHALVSPPDARPSREQSLEIFGRALAALVKTRHDE